MNHSICSLFCFFRVVCYIVIDLIVIILCMLRRKMFCYRRCRMSQQLVPDKLMAAIRLWIDFNATKVYLFACILWTKVPNSTGSPSLLVSWILLAVPNSTRRVPQSFVSKLRQSIQNSCPIATSSSNHIDSTKELYSWSKKIHWATVFVGLVIHYNMN